MRNIFLLILFSFFLYFLSFSQESKYKKYEDKNIKKNPWSLSVSGGYIGIPSPNIGNNIWGSANIGYSKDKWSFVVWSGTNYWIEGKQSDLRLGITTTYTILKW